MLLAHNHKKKAGFSCLHEQSQSSDEGMVSSDDAMRRGIRMLGVLKVIGILVGLGLSIMLIAWLKWIIPIVAVLAFILGWLVPGVNFWQALIGVSVVAIVLGALGNFDNIID